jgi:hypothetical protein
MIPKKPAPDLIRGVQRFSEKTMLKQEALADFLDYPCAVSLTEATDAFGAGDRFYHRGMVGRLSLRR